MSLVAILYGAGLLLIVVEIFVPSMGLLGLLATLSLAGSIGRAFFVDPGTGTALLVTTAILVPVLLTFGLRMFPRTPMGRRLTARGFSFEDGEGTDRRDRGLEGARGVVEATLRPAGIARIGGRRVDVVSRGERLESGTAVVVVEVSGNRVVVAAEAG